MDGQVYHSVIIDLLADGWNPFYHPIIEVSELPYNIDPETTLWCSHYGKGLEIIEAGIVSLTHNLESGKAFNFWMYISLALLGWCFLKDIVNITNSKVRLLFSFILIANPVVINQLFTYYIDYSNYSFICLAIICYCYLILKNQNFFYFVLGLICFFVPSIKFNIAFWFVIILIATSIYVALTTKKIAFNKIIGCALIFCAGFFIGAFNPYVTNYIHKDNVFYPLMGENKLDVITPNIPHSIVDKNRFEQINLSIMSNPENDVEETSIGNPFIINKKGIKASGGWDTRIGGYGFFFFESLIILIVVFFTLNKNRKWIINLGAILFLYLIMLLLPAGFWARYTPFFYLVVCILAIYNYCHTKSRWKLVGCYIAGFLLLIDGIIAFGQSFYFTTAQTIKTDYLISKIKNADTKKIQVSSMSFTLLDKINDLDKNVEFNPEEIENSVAISIYPTPKISYFPELFDQTDRTWAMKAIGYTNFIDTTK